MDLLILFGFASALLVGLVLGLVGGGGSILTVPIFVYLFNIAPTEATAYSLFVVGSVSLFGTLKNAKKKMIEYKTGILFSIPALIVVYLTRKLIVPSIPEIIFANTLFEVNKELAIMMLFASIMLLAAYFMIRNQKPKKPTDNSGKINYFFLALQGVFIGLLSGLVGAGGGFLIIPGLVLLAKLEMKRAVATSLMIIAINSLIGFLGDVGTLDIDWVTLLNFTAIAVAGIYLGIYLNKFIDGKKLKKGFGWFVLLMGLFIIWKEL
jgi:uncharacterized membrane protein YfcA